MDVFHALGAIPKALAALKDLAERIVALHANPRFQALMESDPEIKADADAISRDARSIQEALR